MNAVLFVDRSREWARAIVEAETRGPGDHGDAIRRAAQKLRLPQSSIWALFYRPPKAVAAHVYFGLHDAYAELCAGQMRKFKNELEQTKREAGNHSALVRAAAALAGKDD